MSMNTAILTDSLNEGTNPLLAIVVKYLKQKPDFNVFLKKEMNALFESNSGLQVDRERLMEIAFEGIDFNQNGGKKKATKKPSTKKTTTKKPSTKKPKTKKPSTKKTTKK